MILYQDQIIERDALKIDLEDRGYQFGDGVYEVIKVYDGHFFALQPHLQRLVQSAGEIELDLPVTVNRLEEKLNELIHRNVLKNGHVYLQVTRGIAPRTHQFPQQSEAVLTAYTTETQRPLKKMKNGIKTFVTNDIRWLRCDIKSLNLLGNVLAKQKAVSRGFDEAIFARDGIVTEGSSSNVFIVNDGILQTHPANPLILNGVTRREVIALAEKTGITVKEQPFSVEELDKAEEVFVTSTTMEITPVVEIDGKLVRDGVPGKITRRLQVAFEEKIGQSGVSHVSP